MGIVRLREWKSTGCHEAKALCEEGVSDPAAFDTPSQRKVSTWIDALKASKPARTSASPAGADTRPLDM